MSGLSMMIEKYEWCPSQWRDKMFYLLTLCGCTVIVKHRYTNTLGVHNYSNPSTPPTPRVAGDTLLTTTIYINIILEADALQDFYFSSAPPQLSPLE